MRISKLIRIIGGAIALMILIILLKDQYSSALLKNANYGIPALINKGSVKNLFLGSSMFRQGLDIDVLADNMEDPYILSYNGNQPYLEYIILKKLIDEGVSIDNLYIDMYAYSMCAAPSLSDEKLLLELDISDKWQIYNMLENDGRIKSFYQMFVSANNEMLLTWPVSFPVINGTFRNGGTLSETTGATKEVLGEMGIPVIGDGVQEIQGEYTKKIIDLCTQNNINIFFLETPKYYVVMQDADYEKVMNDYTSIINDNAAILRFETQADVDVNRSVYFIDLLHLSSEGRRVFTKTLLMR